MNTMLEPRIVAARTHAPQAVSVRSEILARIAASSHGGLVTLAITPLLLPRQDSDASQRVGTWRFREITDVPAEFS
jgi:hypothetical protein